MAFGRLNPPTIGHKKLVEKIKSIPGDHYLFLSHTQKPKTDPLTFDQKKRFADRFFPDIQIGETGIKTPVQALAFLQERGYTDVIFVAGSDRVDGFQELFNKYNGTPDKSGNIPFEFKSIRVVSAGDRDPDADGAEGMSASKMRKLAVENNVEEFKQGVPDESVASELFQAVRSGMGLKEPTESFATESNIVLDRNRLVEYIGGIINDYIKNETDIEDLSRVLTSVVGKQVNTKNGKFVVTREDITDAMLYQRPQRDQHG